MKVLVDIPNEKLASFVEWSKENNYKVFVESLDDFSEDFINELKDRASTPISECKNAFERLDELTKQYV